VRCSGSAASAAAAPPPPAPPPPAIRDDQACSASSSGALDDGVLGCLRRTSSTLARLRLRVWLSRIGQRPGTLPRLNTFRPKMVTCDFDQMAAHTTGACKRVSAVGGAVAPESPRCRKRIRHSGPHAAPQMPKRAPNLRHCTRVHAPPQKTHRGRAGGQGDGVEAGVHEGRHQVAVLGVHVAAPQLPRPHLLVGVAHPIGRDAHLRAGQAKRRADQEAEKVVSLSLGVTTTSCERTGRAADAIHEDAANRAVLLGAQGCRAVRCRRTALQRFR